MGGAGKEEARRCERRARFPVIRIECDEMGAWLAITWHGHAWMFGSRKEALAEAIWLNTNALGAGYD